MESLETVKIYVVIDRTPNVVSCSSNFTAEELCILLCKKYGISPLTRTLFALRINDTDHYLKDNSKVLSGTREYELRIRFKVPRLEHLITLDEKTYDYYFQQARNDVYANKISEITYPEHKNALMGLGITDMYRAIVEENLTQDEVKRNCKTYIPKIIMKRHGPFPKKMVHQYLPKMCAINYECSFVKSQYLQQLYNMAPNYLSEEFRDVTWKNGKALLPVYLHVAPFHHQEPGIRLYHVIDKKWRLLCSIEELIYLTRNGEDSLEISRRGTPLFFKFKSEEQLTTFISVCDGYYRLMIKWTFNLSKDDETPSLKELQRMKCHGPVGGAFSYRKLEEKRGKKHGCYIIRQCQDDYNIYYLDVCTKNNTTETYRLEFKGTCYIFNNGEFFNIEALVACHQNPDGRIYLNECLPPSEYDKSQLLLCGEPQKVGVRIDQTELQEILKDNRSPRCLSPKDILLYTGTHKTIKPLYMVQIDNLKLLSTTGYLNFKYYSVSGTAAMWEFPFCDDEYVCEEHTTFYSSPTFFWPVRRSHTNLDLEVSLRSYHSATIYLMRDPHNQYPRLMVHFGFSMDTIEVKYKLSNLSTSKSLGKETHKDLIDYWRWTEFHLIIFGQEMQIMINEDGHFETVLKVRHDIMNSLAWFSVGSEFSIAHWSFYCVPGALPPAYPPECGLTVKDYGYNGTQWVTSSGAWCFTDDQKLHRDLCDVRDCVKEETNIVLTKHGGALRYIYVLPEWKYSGSGKTGSGGITVTFKALWKLDQTRKLEVAYKSLQGERSADHLKDFIELASKWACIQSSSIVRLYGITLNSPTAMVLEYLPYGPFDDYLRKKGSSVTPLHLKKVAGHLARALWDLSEAGVVHGYIRCRRLLVAVADADRIVVKLSGPALYNYTQKDVHWMPVEFFTDMSVARRAVATDIWAFATTLWEIFSYGQKPNETNPVRTAKSYEMGDRLLRPERCPSEVWSLIRQCWQADPHVRARPQEIMRDMNHMLNREDEYSVHNYEEPILSLDHEETVSSGRCIPSEMSDVGSNKSLITVNSSSIPSMNGTSVSDQYDNCNYGDKMSSDLSLNGFLGEKASSTRALLPTASGASTRPSSPVEHSAFHAPRLMESIISQGKTYLVTLTENKLGSGNYGRVYKGWMERDNDKETNRREVAVKILSRGADNNETLYADFKNELEIMKSLQHPNIIEILGYSIDERGCDVRIYMEYMEEGSLNNYLKYQSSKLRISNLLKFCLDIATGMDHVSAKNIVHRDLATRNILVVNSHHVKITDFGLARAVPKEEDAYKVKTNKPLPIDWSAPEAAVHPLQFSTKSDVWSYGVTVWEIFTRGQEHVPRFDTKRPHLRASCFQIPNDCPSEVFRHLMKDCWELIPAKRPTFIDLVHKCKGIMVDYK